MVKDVWFFMWEKKTLFYLFKAAERKLPTLNICHFYDISLMGGCVLNHNLCSLAWYHGKFKNTSFN